MLEQGDSAIRVITKAPYFERMTAALARASIGPTDYPVPVLITHVRTWANSVKKELELYLTDDTFIKAGYTHVDCPPLEAVAGDKKRVRYSQLDTMAASKVSRVWGRTLGFGVAPCSIWFRCSGLHCIVSCVSNYCVSHVRR